MGTIIILGVIGLIIGVYVDQKDSFWMAPMYEIIGVFIGCLAGFLISLALPSKYEWIEYETNIVCLQDGSNTTGSFFLGSGNIGGEMQYIYYSDNGDSTYSLHQLHYTQANIKYTTGKPRLITRQKQETKDWYNNFSTSTVFFREYNVFEIPYGAIKVNYNLDAQ